MIPPKHLQLAFMAALTLPMMGFAQTKVAESGKWSLWEASQNNIETCYVQAVEKILFRKEDFVLEISKAKNKVNSPVEIFMKIQKNKQESTGLVLNLVSGGQLGFADLSGSKEQYWAVPKDLSKLIQQLRQGQDATGRAVGGKKEIEFAMNASGFKDMIAEMEKRCNSGSSLVDAAFETELLSAVSAQVDPTRLNPTKAQQLRASYFAAFGVHTQKLDTQKALQKVLDKYQHLIDELKTNRDEQKRITQSDLPSSEKTLAEAIKTQIDQKTEIARLQTLIPQLIKQVEVSQKSLDAARAVLAPLVPEHSRLTSQLRNAQSTLSQAQSRLAELDRRAQEVQSGISQLASEADNIERWLPSKRSDLDRAISVLRDAEFRRSQFNVQWEIDRRLRSNGEYTRIVSERQSIDGQLSAIQSEVARIQAERNRIARDLEACRASGQGSVGVILPPPGQGGLTPGIVAAGALATGAADNVEDLSPVPADCSRHESALQQADQMLREKETQARQVINRKNELDRAIESTQRSVENQVRQEYDSLVGREDVARREVRRIEDDVQRDQSRLSQIRNSELPRLQDEQRSLANERPSVVSRINQAKAAVDRSQTELAQFKQANDWDRKAADVDAKEKKLSADQSSLAQSQEALTTAERRLARAIETEAKMKEQIASLKARVVVLDKRAVELEAGLKNLPSERGPLDAKIASLQKELNAKREEILNLLRS